MGNNHQESDSFDNTYTEKPGMFGHPYKELQDYFNGYPSKGTLLDLGCGQGRDSIFLASIGYQVTAVDSSEVGVKQMMSQAQSQGVKIDGIVADVQNFKLEEKFDVVLFDMLLHAFEEPQQVELLKKFADTLTQKGILCLVFPDDMKTDHFMKILNSLPHKWELKDEIVIRDIPKIDDETIDFTFIMISIQLISRH